MGSKTKAGLFAGAALTLSLTLNITLPGTPSVPRVAGSEPYLQAVNGDFRITKTTRYEDLPGAENFSSPAIYLAAVDDLSPRGIEHDHPDLARVLRLKIAGPTVGSKNRDL